MVEIVNTNNLVPQVAEPEEIAAPSGDAEPEEIAAPSGDADASALPDTTDEDEVQE